MHHQGQAVAPSYKDEMFEDEERSKVKRLTMWKVLCLALLVILVGVLCCIVGYMFQSIKKLNEKVDGLKTQNEHTHGGLRKTHGEFAGIRSAIEELEHQLDEHEKGNAVTLLGGLMAFTSLSISAHHNGTEETTTEESQTTEAPAKLQCGKGHTMTANAFGVLVGLLVARRTFNY